MKIRYLVFLLFSFSSLACFAQTTAPTPMPPVLDVKIDELKTPIPESPLKISGPLFEIRDTGRRNITISARSSKLKEFAASGFRLEFYLREWVWGQKDREDDNPSVSFLIDGQLFPVTKRLSDKTYSYISVVEEPTIYTRTFMLDVPPENMDSLSKAKSISVMWNNENFQLTPIGLEKLRRFILDDFPGRNR